MVLGPQPILWFLQLSPKVLSKLQLLVISAVQSKVHTAQHSISSVLSLWKKNNDIDTVIESETFQISFFLFLSLPQLSYFSPFTDPTCNYVITLYIDAACGVGPLCCTYKIFKNIEENEREENG